MDFGEAIKALKDGKRVQRACWDEGMWLAYMPGVKIDEGLVNGRTRKFVPTGDLNVGGYIVVATTGNSWQPGWLASQADMLSEDWLILLPGEEVLEEVSSGQASPTAS